MGAKGLDMSAHLGIHISTMQKVRPVVVPKTSLWTKRKSISRLPPMILASHSFLDRLFFAHTARQFCLPGRLFTFTRTLALPEGLLGASYRFQSSSALLFHVCREVVTSVVGMHKRTVYNRHRL